jgi:hypothetical protein
MRSAASQSLHDQSHHSPRLNNEDHRPQEYADTGGSGGYVFNDLDLPALFGGNEIAGGLDGAVEELSLKHQCSSSGEKKKIDPLPEEKEDQEHSRGQKQFVGNAQVIPYCVLKTGDNHFYFPDGMVPGLPCVEKFITHDLLL